MLLPTIVAGVFASIAAAKDSRTFAVLHHYGNGPLVTTRLDPIVSPNEISTHVHTVMGASNFGANATGEYLRKSRCTTALVKGDLSAYWFPLLYFQDPKDGHFENVEMFYFNTYYFFEPTNDKIVSFPVGLKMISGNAMTRDPPNKDGSQNLDPSKGPVNPLQWTCPRSSYNPPSYPPGSDGTKAGIQDPHNQGAGVGFPFANCDGYASPLRMDLHFPSCYNPAAGLENYESNMAWPTDAGDGKQDCPKGYLHVPHIFFEVYWNTPKFQDRWTPNDGSQPFVLANGDRSGYSGHGDFISGWEESVLQQIIDNCAVGTAGMDKCPGLIGGVNDPSTSCNIPSPVDEVVEGKLSKLPGNNPVTGWGLGNPPAAAPPQGGSSSKSSSKSSSTSTRAPAQGTGPATKVVNPGPASSSKSSPATTTKKPATTTKKASSPTTSSKKPLTTAPAAAKPTPAPPKAGSPAPGSVSTSTVYETVTEYMTVTVTADAAAACTAAPSTVAGFQYAGCFKDASDRVLSGEIRPDLGKMTNELCVSHCKSKGFALAGTEYGGQCYCGDELVGSARLDEAACGVACEGDAKESCGGGWALSVYSASGSVKSSPAKARRDSSSRHLQRHRRGPSARRN